MSYFTTKNKIIIGLLVFIYLLFVGCGCSVNQKTEQQVDENKPFYDVKDVKPFIDAIDSITLVRVKDDLHAVSWKSTENIWEFKPQLAVDFAAEYLARNKYTLKDFNGYGLWKEQDKLTITVFFYVERKKTEKEKEA